MKGLKRFRSGWAWFGRVRMAVGSCGELRRTRRDGPVFRRTDEAPEGPYFGSWL